MLPEQLLLWAHLASESTCRGGGWLGTRWAAGDPADRRTRLRLYCLLKPTERTATGHEDTEARAGVQRGQLVLGGRDTQRTGHRSRWQGERGSCPEGAGGEGPSHRRGARTERPEGRCRRTRPPEARQQRAGSRELGEKVQKGNNCLRSRGELETAQEDLHLRNQQTLHTGPSTEPLPRGLVVGHLPAHHCVNTPPPDGQGFAGPRSGRTEVGFLAKPRP